MLYTAWGRALGRQLPPLAKFVVGGDLRDSTPAFQAALLEGLCQAGLDVVDLGRLPAPMIHYAKQRLQAAGCAIVTASHAPATINGLEWMLGDEPPTPKDVAAMEQAIDRPGNDDRIETTPRTVDVSFDYVATLQERFVDSLAAHRRVVLDPLHGCWVEKARRYLHAIFPQCLFSTLHNTPDAQLAGQASCGSTADVLADLSDAVYRERAHLGIAMADDDRVALVDNEGVVLNPEETVWVLLNCFAGQLSGEQFVCDSRFSDRLAETARHFGAAPVTEQSGSAFLRARMRRTEAILGAGIGGRFFHRDLEGGADALYTACLVIEFLAKSNRSLAELRRDCPPVYATPDLRIPMPLEEQPHIIEEIKAAWPQFSQRTADGLRIDTPGGCAFVHRASGEPAMTFRFEGLDWPALDDLVERFCDVMSDFGDELWVRYRTAVGGG